MPLHGAASSSRQPSPPLFTLPQPVPGGLAALAARRGPGAAAAPLTSARRSPAAALPGVCSLHRLDAQRCARPRRGCVLAAAITGALALLVAASRGVGVIGGATRGGGGGVAGSVVESVFAIEAGGGRVDPSSFAARLLVLSPPPPPPSPRARPLVPTRAPRRRGGANDANHRRLELFFAWIGSAVPPYKQLQRVLLDVVQQTKAAEVELHLMVEDTPAAEANTELLRHLQTVASLGTPRGTSFSWTLLSFVAFRERSAYYAHLCADFQGNIFHANAKEYACQFLVKPLLWEIVPPREGGAGQHLIVALDTDLRIAGDLLDIIDEHAAGMRQRGALMALTAEQQPTYAFNSPQGVRGFNGGVQLIDVTAMAASQRYHDLLRVFTWTDTDPRWRPATDLGDQTLYSIFNYSDPTLFLEMGCGWNRQLCRGWFFVFAERTPRHFLYQHELDALCLVHPRDIRVLHGNCRSQRPGSDELDGLPDTWQDRNAAAEAELEATFRRVYAAEIEANGGLVGPPTEPR